jgi:predicted dehydrogenase
VIQRALVAGLGSIGRRHLRVLRDMLPTADIRVLRHSGCEAPIEHADGCFDSIEAAVTFAPELAVIANPAPFHLSASRVLAEAGAHLLVEKPASDSAEGLSDLIALCKAQARVFQLGYNLRFLETLQIFRGCIASGCIGTVQTVHCEIGQYLPAWRPDVDYRDSVSARRALGGGVLLELSHELDMLRWVFGEVEWLSAWTGRQGMLEIDVEDCAMLQMGFVAGPVAQLGMDFLRRDTTRTCTAIGAEGSLRWDAIAGQVARYDSDANVWVELSSVRPGRDFSYRAQIETLLAAIDGHPGDVAAQGIDGLAVMRLIDAARLSDAQQGRRIILREMP